MSETRNAGITIGLVSGRQIYVTPNEAKSFVRIEDECTWTTDKSFGQFRTRTVPVTNIEMLEYHYETVVRATN